MNRSTGVVIFMFAACLAAAPRDRITGPIDASRRLTVSGMVHNLASSNLGDPTADQGAVDPSLQITDVMIMFKLSAEQQSDLDQQLADQQNPASPQYHKWLTPEEYANRYGLSPSDHSKVAAWLNAQGFTVNR